MATILDVLHSFDQRSKEYEEFLQELICINGDIPFDTEEVGTIQNIVISNVNARLNQSHTRTTGLIILHKILPQCSKETLTKYCILWIAKATQVLESIHSTLHDLTEACRVIGELISRSREISEIQKQISMQNVKQLIGIIDSLDSERQCGAVYYLVTVLLYQYPEVCERFQAQIKKLILLQIDSDEDNLVSASAKCYTLLVKATERSFKPPSSRPNYNCCTYNQALICNSLHNIMDELFHNMLELQTVDTWDQLTLQPISQENVIQYYSTQKQRFRNLCSYLSFVLRGYGKTNSVAPHDIFQVLCRGLAITPLNLKNKSSFKEQMLYLILPHLHVALLNVLDALIYGFKHQLIPFGSTVLKLFHQTLQWTETVVENQVTITGHQSFKNVRIFVYKCLSSWLEHTNSLSGVETIAEEYLPSILKDVTPERDRVLLTIQKTQNLSKKALKRLRDSQYEKSAHLKSGAAMKKQFSLDIDVCQKALDVLQNIFFSAGSLLKQSFYKSIQNVIIPILYDSYLKSTEAQFYKENPNCRLMLLRVLRALQMNPHPLIPAPTQYCIEIFELALNDTDLYIIQEAKIGLAELEKIVHPIAPSLKIYQSEESEKEFTLNNEQHNTEDVEEAVMINDVDTADEDEMPTLNKRAKVTHTSPNDCIKENNSTHEICTVDMTCVDTTLKNVDTETGHTVVRQNQSEPVHAEDEVKENDTTLNSRIESEPANSFDSAPSPNPTIDKSKENNRNESPLLSASGEDMEKRQPKEITGKEIITSSDEWAMHDQILQLFHDEPQDD